MGAQKIIIIAVVVILALGALWFFLQSGDDGDLSQAETTREGGTESTERELTEADEESLSGMGSMRDLLALGRSIKCTYTYASTDEVEGGGSGTSYIDGERMRVDSNYTMDGSMYESHMISDGETLYSWSVSSEGSFAFMYPIPEDEDTEDYTPPKNPMMDGESEAQSLDNEVEYDCESWRVDQGVFVPPSNIEFMDMSAMMGGSMMQGIPSGYDIGAQGMMDIAPVSQ